MEACHLNYPRPSLEWQPRLQCIANIMLYIILWSIGDTASIFFSLQDDMVLSVSRFAYQKLTIIIIWYDWPECQLASVGNVWSWIKVSERCAQFFIDSTASVRANASELFSVSVRLRQGCVMSPWLLNICMIGMISQVNARGFWRGALKSNVGIKGLVRVWSQRTFLTWLPFVHGENYSRHKIIFRCFVI